MNRNRSRDLALFDFDGTITGADTLFHFLRFAVPGPRFVLGAVLLSPLLLAYRLGLVGNARAKSLVLAHFFRGLPAEDFRARGAAFAEKVLPGLIRPAALERIREHQARGDRVLVVSASLSDWVGDWCAAQGLELVATEAEVLDGRITGRFSTPNCHGPEKVRRVREVLDPASFARIHAYGDSSGDREMLALAHEPHFRPFRT